MTDTKRRGFHWDESDGNYRLGHGLRDRGCSCWQCNGWKRPERRRDRHRAAAGLRHEPADE